MNTESKTGIINDFKIALVKKDVDLIERISKRRGITVEAVERMLRYNVWTFNQLAELSGLKISTLHGKSRPTVINNEIGTEIDIAYPFRDIEGMGPKMIIRNDKSMKLL